MYEKKFTNSFFYTKNLVFERLNVYLTINNLQDKKDPFKGIFYEYI